MNAAEKQEVTSTPLVLTFYQDPGHGWVAAPHYLVKMLGIEGDISPFSYVDGNFVYLEEDCDLSIFLRAIEDKGITIQFDEEHSDEDSPIRNKRSFSVESLNAGNKLIDVKVFAELTVIDTDNQEKVVGGDFNWTVLSDKCAEEVESNLRDEVERVTKYGSLHNKKAVKAEVKQSFILVEPPGQGLSVHRYPLPEISINF